MPKTPKISDEDLCARLALVLVETGMRNSRLEALHAGISPDSAVGDYSDVKVVTPYGEIPWSRVSRLDDEEMKALMTEVVDRVYTILTYPDASWRLVGAARWDKPKLSPALMTWVRKAQARQSGVPEEVLLSKSPHEAFEPLPPIRREQRAAAYEAERDKPHERWSSTPRRKTCARWRRRRSPMRTGSPRRARP
jgi:hypothetical protein